MTQKKLVSFVVPVLNEELNIIPFYETLIPVIKRCESQYDFEILFTDNHSTDRTFEHLTELAQTDKRIRVLRFSRNYGYQKSILTGYLHAQGEAVIQLDCDLQDPPAMVIDFLKHWEAGNAVVYGIRRKTRDKLRVSMARKLFYRFINFLSEDELPLDAGDFRLIDRKVIEALREMNDERPYLRGAIATVGFKQQGIPYDRSQRQLGVSNFGLRDMIALALDGILNHSIIPLRLASFFGIFVSLFSAALSVIYLIGKTIFNLSWPAGFTTITILILLSTSMNALFLGIIGEYLGRVYQQVKKKPVIIEAMIGSSIIVPKGAE